MTNWKDYQKCRCGAAQGEQCEHMVLRTTRGKPVYEDRPQPWRKKVEMPRADKKTP